MSERAATIKAQLGRQVAHWITATARLENPDDIASEAAWSYLEQYLGVTIRARLAETVGRLRRQAAVLKASFDAARSPVELEEVRRRLLDYRHRYLRTETTLDFFADAINTRTSPGIRAYLRACDSLGHRSMAMVLDQLSKPVPVVLTYIDKGLGASILKADLRLWDGTVNPAAAIKITRHNLHRPTSLIHETGHQMAHIAGWNDELASALNKGLESGSPQIAMMWAGWASEIAADAHAFVHTGYAAVATLHDVLAGDEPQVFRLIPGDPHPVGYLRVLLGVEMCRQFYGSGPWDDLALMWVQQHPLESAGHRGEELIRQSLPLLPRVVEITLRQPMKAFGSRPLSALVNPARVSPEALRALGLQLGAAMYTSTHWVWHESLRTLAYTGLRLATEPERELEILQQQESWMFRLGDMVQAA
jgi:hypothetical protein